MAQSQITFEDIKKTYNKVLAEYGIVRKGACLMTDAKRAELRKVYLLRSIVVLKKKNTLK